MCKRCLLDAHVGVQHMSTIKRRRVSALFLWYVLHVSEIPAFSNPNVSMDIHSPVIL